MNYNQIHRHIRMILYRKMNVSFVSRSYTANFYDDFGLTNMELNLLIYNVENHFGITLDNGLENNINTINQLVDEVYRVRELKFVQVASVA